MSLTTPNLEALQMACLEILQCHPAGLSEFQLLQALRADEYALLPSLEVDDHLGLFRSHFLLYHTLYCLRDRMHGERRGVLQISALQIRLDNYRETKAALCEGDPLRDYYLDLNNLAQMGREGVEALLADFWRHLAIGSPQRVATALAVLELDEAADFAMVKAQYRRLAMRHHPDRGGDAVKMHALNEALELLRIHFHR